MGGGHSQPTKKGPQLHQLPADVRCQLGQVCRRQRGAQPAWQRCTLCAVTATAGSQPVPVCWVAGASVRHAPHVRVLVCRYVLGGELVKHQREPERGQRRKPWRPSGVLRIRMAWTVKSVLDSRNIEFRLPCCSLGLNCGFDAEPPGGSQRILLLQHVLLSHGSQLGQFLSHVGSPKNQRPCRTALGTVPSCCCCESRS